jgi:hypothetical protein
MEEREREFTGTMLHGGLGRDPRTWEEDVM